MKFKLLLAILLIPFSVMAANTNVFDRVLIRSNFQFTGGVVGANKVLTSDGAGFYTPQSITSLGGFAVTNGNNFFTSASTNTFNAPTFTSNLVVRGTLSVNTNASTRDLVPFIVFPKPGQTFNIAAIMGDTSSYNAGLSVGDGETAGNLYWDIFTARATGKLTMDFAGSSFTSADFIFGANTMMNISPTVATIGASSASSLVLPGNTITAPNGFSLNVNQLSMAGSGSITNGSGLILTSNLYAGPLGAPVLAPFVFVQTNQATFQTTLATYNYSSVNIAQQTQVRARGTIAAPTAVQLNDTLAAYAAKGHNGTTFPNDSGSFSFKAYQNFNAGSNGTFFALFLTQTNLAATTVSEKMRFTPDRGGTMGLATNTPDAALHVGMGNVAGVSGAGVGHFDGGTIVGPSGTGTLVTAVGYTNFTWTPGSVGAVGTTVTNMSVSGVAKGSTVLVGPNVFVSGLIWRAYCTNVGVVTVALNNITAIGIDPGVHTNGVRFWNP